MKLQESNIQTRIKPTNRTTEVIKIFITAYKSNNMMHQNRMKCAPARRANENMYDTAAKRMECWAEEGPNN